MPKRVDHDERRRQITDALLRIASSRGLQAVTMREVAAEAGVSLRLVQYYFTDKRTLMVSGLAELAAGLDRRVKARAAARGPDLSARAALEVVLTSILPLDEESVQERRAWTAYYAAVLSDPSLVEGATHYPNALEQFLTARLTARQEAGEFPADQDPGTEVAALLALTNGLADSVAGGQRSAADAERILRLQLDRVFGAPPAG